jgi:signal transduction histidine kinase
VLSPSSPLDALRHRDFLRSAWPWRSARYALGSVPVMIGAALPAGLIVLPWVMASVQLTRGGPPGVPMLLILLGALLVVGCGPVVAAPVATVERRRLRAFEGVGASPWAERRRWSELSYTALLVIVLPLAYVAVGLLIATVLVSIAGPLLVHLAGPVAVGIGTVHTVPEAIPRALVALTVLPAFAYLVTALAGGHAALARMLLLDAPDFVAVRRSRTTRMVDAFDAERRRIERDLHDGAQQRLVGLTLQLGIARFDLPPDTPGAAAVARAHDQARELMVELRELIHGIHPHLLTDQGLPTALRDLADRCPVPAEVHAEIAERLPERVEATAYFVVAEALTNVVRHADARAVRVTVRRARGALIVEVTDDGRGGADPAAGSGLTGLSDRIAATGGQMLLSSPAGGPTRIRAVLPCR